MGPKGDRMKRLVRDRFVWLCTLSALVVWSANCQPTDPSVAAGDTQATSESGVLDAVERISLEPTLVVLVRHAEKVDDSRDPDLSTEGLARSAQLAEMLEDLEFDHVWSTDFKRTRDTAAPTAQGATLTTELYDPGDLASVATHLTNIGGRHLVVGHSNTTPQLVAALGGDPGTPIDDAEYDRLYVVTVGSDGTATTVLLRFGVPFGG